MIGWFHKWWNVIAFALTLATTTGAYAASYSHAISRIEKLEVGEKSHVRMHLQLCETMTRILCTINPQECMSHRPQCTVEGEQK